MQFEATFMNFTFTPSDGAMELALLPYEAPEADTAMELALLPYEVPEADTAGPELVIAVFSGTRSLQETSRKLTAKNTNRVFFARFFGFEGNAFIKMLKSEISCI